MNPGFITLCVTFLYCIFILYCYYSWNTIHDRTEKKIQPADIKVTVIVPFRNEASNLPGLIQSLKLQDFPRQNHQVILVDDHSTDASMEAAMKMCESEAMDHVVFLRSPKHSKKEAISFAVGHSTSELIVTTDADTQMGSEWLSVMVDEYSATNAALICGPVKISGAKKYSERLQEIEFCGLNAMGAAMIADDNPMFCNGANLAFNRAVFNVLKGYENSRTSTGDDTQLMMKIHRAGLGRIIFLKDRRAIVETRIIEDKSDLLHQRKRWASKIPTTLSAFTIVIASLSWLAHGLILFLMIYSMLRFDFFVLAIVIGMKSLTEIIFLKSAGRFYGLTFQAPLIVLAQPVYCLYIFYVGLVAPFSSWEWKGRKGK